MAIGRGSHLVPSQTLVSTVPTLVLSFNPTRVSAIINNVGTSTIYLSTQEGMQNGEGFPLAAGQALELTHSSQLFATVASGTVLLGILEEVR